MAAKIPQRTFTAIEENPSLGNNGPIGLKTDIDVLITMVNPDAIHDTGEPGGIQVGNIAHDSIGNVGGAGDANKIVQFKEDGSLPGNVATAENLAKITVTDANNAKPTGCYYITPSAGNHTPDESRYWYLFYVGSSITGVQTAYRAPGSLESYRRYSSNDVWGPWVQMTDENGATVEATGDTRFQVSGNTEAVFSLGANASRKVQEIIIVVPVGKQLRLKGARYVLRGDFGMTPRLKIVGTNTWISSSFFTEELNINFVLANSGTIELEFYIFNNSVIAGSIEPGNGWWVDLAIEDI